MCLPAHPATQLAGAPNALVGVVESSRTIGNDGAEFVVRVERTLKGVASERITLRSGLTSCQVVFQAGQRIGVTFNRPDEIQACGVSDPDALIAASELPAARGTPRLAAAVAGVRGLDTVLLSGGGRIAGYEPPRGEVLAQSDCGRAVRAPDGRVLVDWTELPLRDVSALGCTENGRRLWAVGSDGRRMRLLSVRDGRVEERMRRRADLATIAGGRAYFVHGTSVRMVALDGGRDRSARIDGRFTAISGNGDRVAGRLRDGRTAVLDVRTGELVTRRGGGRVVWLDEERLVGGDGVYDVRLRRVRPVTTRGTLVGVAGGAAFFADGKVLLRLAPGARRAVRFARLPGRVTDIVAAPGTPAQAAAWHSCEESAKTPLTT